MDRSLPPLLGALLLIGSAGFPSMANSPARPTTPHQYIYFGLERGRIVEAEFLETDSIEGAQLKYTWRELEPERDRYALDRIEKDLAYLSEHGKKLFIQLQDVSFEESIINVPDYLLTDPAFSGGVARQYSDDDDDDATPPIAEGWVARRWDEAVIERFGRLLAALGRRFDGRIEGLSLAETSIGFGSVELQPEDYTCEKYYEGVKSIMTLAGEAFSESHVILYANFMPGEWLPGGDKGFLKGIYAYADEIGVGVGGPDVLPHRRWQRKHSYALIPGRAEHTVAGNAVQWGNLEDIDPATGNPVTVEELHRFARDTLRLDYLFWGTQEPYYTRDVIPYLRSLEPADEKP